jgi:hypothetical protein
MVRFVYERAREHAREIQGKVYRKFVFFLLRRAVGAGDKRNYGTGKVGTHHRRAEGA